MSETESTPFEKALIQGLWQIDCTLRGINSNLADIRRVLTGDTPNIRRTDGGECVGPFGRSGD